MKRKRKDVRNRRFVVAYEARGREFESLRAYHLPTRPLELARPSGSCLQAESSSNLADFTPFAHKTAILARCMISLRLIPGVQYNDRKETSRAT